MKQLILSLFSVFTLFTANAQDTTQRSASAHCYGKIMAYPVNGCGSIMEVDKWAKGGYMGCPICTPKCQDYCEGRWDATSQSDFIALARKSASCGKVRLVLTSSCGTCYYGPNLRTITVDLGGTCISKCDCSVGFTYDPVDQNCKKQLCPVPGTPNQSLGTFFFIYNGYMYQIGTKYNCTNICR
jgi:hypothetical protein